jgi:hypothetical protein
MAIMTSGWHQSRVPAGTIKCNNTSNNRADSKAIQRTPGELDATIIKYQGEISVTGWLDAFHDQLQWEHEDMKLIK